MVQFQEPIFQSSCAEHGRHGQVWGVGCCCRTPSTVGSTGSMSSSKSHCGTAFLIQRASVASGISRCVSGEPTCWNLQDHCGSASCSVLVKGPDWQANANARYIHVWRDFATSPCFLSDFPSPECKGEWAPAVALIWQANGQVALGSWQQRRSRQGSGIPWQKVRWAECANSRSQP